MNNLRRLPFLLGILVLFLFGFSNEQSGIPEVNIKKLPNMIELSWSPVPLATEYLIYRDGKIIYNDIKNGFSHKNLEDGEYVEYHLVAIDSQETILAHTLVKTSVVHPKFASQVGMDIIVSKDSIALDWKDLANAEKYSIQVNEGFPMFKSNSDIKLTKLENESSYDISMFAEDTSNKTKSKDEEKGDHYITVPVITLQDFTGLSLSELSTETPIEEAVVNSTTEGPYVDPIEGTIGIDEPINGIEGVDEPTFATSAGSVSTLKHRTFIRPNPFKFSLWSSPTIQCGKGDGRTFSPTAGTSRTQVFVSVYWDTRTYGFSKYAYGSTMYDRTCNTSTAYTKYPTTSGIGLSVKYIYASEAGFHLTHRAASPHTFSGVRLPDIYYYYNLTMTKAGATYMYGSHDQFPWHEIYRSNNGGTWRELYTYSPTNGGADAWKLISPWPNKTIDDRNY
ncbi:DUF3238 domain-containing protein [Planococcus salinarum]|uniref:DUF3238 domain-containing protein n=1 Tax=Planococcus salinarum TaxID=622695 RepID=UPI000E3D9B8D|nr:DUF3238 domain-containing protein [Planococcus salinarum]TAA68732.1 DUF3238 domain-containing protein [Planococcus salinarum]